MSQILYRHNTLQTRKYLALGTLLYNILLSKKLSFHFICLFHCCIMCAFLRVILSFLHHCIALNSFCSGVLIYVNHALPCKVLMKGGPFNLNFLLCQFLYCQALVQAIIFVSAFFIIPHHHQFLFLIIFVSPYNP